MSRKYRQSGYQDNERESRARVRKPSRPRGAPEFRPKPMPSFQEVIRCTMCGATTSPDIGLETQCPKCGADLHTCRQCVFFDTSARLECTQKIPERIPRKSVRNQCGLFVAKKTIERQTTSFTPSTPGPKTAREAFDALFKN